MRLITLIASAAVLLTLGGCLFAPAGPALTPIATQTSDTPPDPTQGAAAITTPLAASPSAPPTPPPPDYTALEAALADYAASLPFLVGAAFVDLITGQQAGANADLRFYALSTFKGPLAAYYLWQVDRGLMTITPEDEAYLTAMLAVSDNPATACVIERTGGLAGFNNWLASYGLPRDRNFVYAWEG